MNLITTSQWQKLGEDVVKTTISLIKNLFYFKTKPYSKTYRELKVSGQAHPNQISRSPKPDLTLTGDMLSSFSVRRVTKSGVVIGFESIKMAKRMNKNARLGRDMMPIKNGGILPPVDAVIEKALDRYINDFLNKIYNH